MVSNFVVSLCAQRKLRAEAKKRDMIVNTFVRVIPVTSLISLRSRRASLSVQSVNGNANSD